MKRLCLRRDRGGEASLKKIILHLPKSRRLSALGCGEAANTHSLLTRFYFRQLILELRQVLIRGIYLRKFINRFLRALRVALT